MKKLITRILLIAISFTFVIVFTGYAGSEESGTNKSRESYAVLATSPAPPVSPSPHVHTAGSLDAAFGKGGKVNTAIRDSSDSAHAVVIQADGKIIAAGHSYNSTNTNKNFTLVRYNVNGTLDTTFGTTGMVTTAIRADSDSASDVAVQSDGKIVAVGYSGNGKNLDFGIVRYNINGTLDTTFGTGGKVTTTIVPNLDGYAYAVAIQPDNKIIAAGVSSNSLSHHDFALVRYNTDGTLDTTFGATGKVITDFGTSSVYATSVAVQSDGKIIAAGQSYNELSTDFALVRYNTDGTLDTTFGTEGKLTIDFGTSDDFASSLAIQSDGKIIAAGNSRVKYSANGDFALVRLNKNGTLDTTFDTDGKVITPIREKTGIAFAVSIQSDGKIVAAGSLGNGVNNDFALMRYNKDGTLDTAFGTTGKVTTDFGKNDDFASSLAIQSDGKIIASGYTYNGANYDFALVRYWP